MSVPIYAYALPTLAAAGYDVRKITSILRCQIAGCTRTATRIAGCGKGQRETENGWLLCASCASHCFYKLGKIARLREAEFYEKRVRNIDMTEIPGPPIVNGDEAAKRDELANHLPWFSHNPQAIRPGNPQRREPQQDVGRFRPERGCPALSRNPEPEYIERLGRRRCCS
jgi:hypothetical protein